MTEKLSKNHNPPTQTGRIGPYALVRRIGAGGMGEVWVGRRDGLAGGASKMVAVKLMARSIAFSQDARRMFETEARLSMMLSHSNIVQVFDVGEHQGQGYLAMEWVDGVDLATVIQFTRSRLRPISFELAVYIVGEMLHGLTYAHGLVEDGVVETVIHRDISPHNVLVSVSGEVKITDFGIARLRSEDTSGLHIRGKLRYMPPEQAAGEARAPTVDLFAVGAVFHELLDGVGFRRGIGSDELFRVVASGVVPPLTRAGVPGPLRELIAGLLQPRVGDRVSSAAEALEILRRYEGDHRGARAELAALIREVSGVEGPRSGLHIDGRTRPSVHSDVVTRVRSHTATPQPANYEADVSSEAHQAATRVDRVSAVMQLQPSPAPQRRRGWAIGAAALSLVVGFALAWGLGARLQHQPKHGREIVGDGHFESAEHVVEDRAEPGTAAARDSGPPDPRRDVPPAVAGEAPASDPTASEPVPGPKRPSTKTKRRPRTRSAGSEPAAPSSVTFTSGEFHWIEIEVGGERLSLDPRASTSLPPGRHVVKLREGADAPWRRAGTLTVEPGHSYRVDFQLPATFRLVKLG